MTALARAVGVMLVVAAAAPMAAAQSVAPFPGAAWTRAEPAAQGVDPAPWASLDSTIRSGRYGHVDQVLVIRRGYQVLDYRYPKDYSQIAAGRRSPIGCGPGACEGFRSAPGFNYFDPATHPFRAGTRLHSLQSATKSVIATVLGVAMHRGALASLETPLLAHLGSYAAVAPDPRLRAATLVDLLTMRTGIEWHEQDRPLDSTNTTIQLEASEDWVRFTLSQPMDAEPGTKWAYNSGGSHLIGAVVREVTGESPAEYARTHLFAPLGIDDFYWKPAGGGLPDGEGGLYLTAESLARIGYLYLRDGVWNGTRLLPEGWVRTATSRIVELGGPAARGYGYQWWRVDRDGLEVWAAMGFGGQFLLVMPALDMVVVATGWNVYGDQVAGLVGPLLTVIQRSTGVPPR